MRLLRFFLVIFVIYFSLPVLATYSATVVAKITTKESPLFYKANGDHYRRIGLLDKALNEYDKAVSIKSDFADVYYFSAYIYKEKGLYVQALFEIELGLKNKESFSLVSRYYDLLFLEVELYLKLYQQEGVAELLDSIIFLIKEELKNTKSLKEDIRNYFSYTLGKAYFYKGKFLLQENKGKRLNYFDKAIAYAYKKDLVHYNKYLLYLSLIENVKASQSIKQALKLNPNIILDVKRMAK